MTDNVIQFPKKDAPKTEAPADVSPQIRATFSDATAKAMGEIIKDLRLQRSDLYFDTHLIVNDRIFQDRLRQLVSRIVELGTDPNPPSTGPITDHKS